MCVHSGSRFVFVSSREVYGEQDTFPVSEAAEKRPKNLYARSKFAGEDLVMLTRVSPRIAGEVVRAFSRRSGFGAFRVTGLGASLARATGTLSIAWVMGTRGT